MAELKEIVLFEGKLYTRKPEDPDHRARNYFVYGGEALHVAIWKAHHKKQVPPGHVIHHKNHNPLDNRPANLACLTRAEHTRIHKELEWKTKKAFPYVCEKCGKDFLSRTSKAARPKFCGRACRRNSYTKMFDCTFCGGEFEARSDSRGKFCSKICSNRATGAAKAARYLSKSL